ncbi:fibronectin type III domain-containing protein [Geomonas sp. RF6]|uniref:fibronectin type III domain-containing protein n=1 Tax=Geomonas sp. RF6 TaxID=2897342 RepID=UPI001E47259D|nr:putative Ig domain-containing protein [Geomonas sp. RF6]UFS70323.1 fibronectin type III domain-containing protein [Geomonas sp. RF6]
MSVKPYRSLILFLLSLLVLPAVASGAGGDVVWQFGDSPAGKQEAKASVVDKNGDVVVTGYQLLPGGSDDYYTVKFKGDGAGVAWRAVVDKAGGSDQATAVTIDSNNDVIVTGSVWSGRNTDIHTVKYSGATGEILWQHTFNGGANGIDRGTSVCVDADDNVYVGGYTQNSSGGTDYLVLKYGPAGPVSGAPAWKAAYHGSAADANRVNSITAGPGGIAVTGESWNATSGAFEFATVKFGYDGSQLWEKRHSTATAEGKKLYCSGRYARFDAAGNLVVTGSVSNGIDLDIYTAKLAADTGAILWENTYNGAYDDEPYGVVIEQGAVFVAGYTWTLTGTNDFYTARYDAQSGTLVWGSVYDSGNGNDDITVATGIVTDPAGDVFVTGYTIAGGNYDFKTVKYKKDDGTQLWSIKFDGSAGLNDRPVGIGLSPAGEVLVSGWSDSDANDLDYYVIKYDPGLLNAPSNLTVQAASNTSIRLSFTDNASNEESFGIERCAGAGCTEFAPLMKDGAPLRLPPHTGTGQVSYLDTALVPNSYYSYRVKAANSANGESHYSNVAQTVTTYISMIPPAWSYSYNGVAAQEEAASGIAVGPDGNPVVTGYTRDYPLGYSAGASYDYVTLKLPRAGGTAPLWTARYNDPNTRDDFATCVAVDSGNKVTVSGYATLYNGVNADVFSLYTIRYSSSGAVLATDQYNGPVAGGATDDRSVAIASTTDSSGATAIVGYGLVSAGNDNIYLLKYNADGSRAWAATPADGAGGDDLPSAVAFAPDGSIYVTGYSERQAHAGVYKLFTARYNGSTGALIWRDLYSLTLTGDNKGQALAIDSQGNVYVTGSATNAAGNRDIYTVKYRGGASTPDRLWERVADGAAHGDDSAVSVKIDAADGTIIVAGTVESRPLDRDFRVIKYTPAGDVVWDTTYFKPGSSEEGGAMVLDSLGYAYVTGHTDNSDGSTIDSVTVRFAPDGGIVGATIYNGAANGNDDSYAMTVSPDDEVFVAGYTDSASGKGDILAYMIAPPEPRNLALVSSNTTQATISWGGSPFGETSFRIERCAGASCTDFAAVGSAAARSTLYTDSTICSGGSYRYRVVAVGDGWESLPSKPVTVATSAGVPPASVTVVSATESQVDLSWGDTNGDETGYLIERCTGASCTNFSPLTTVLPANTASYSDLKLPVNTTYRYRISAVKSASCSWQAPAAAVSATTALLSPTGLTAQGDNSTQVTLNWTNRTTTETGLKIERCTGVGCSDYAQVGTTTAKAVTFKDTAVCAGTVYSYRVRANNSLAPWDSEYSGVAVVATPAAGNLLADPGFENGSTAWTGAVGTLTGTSFDTSLFAEGTRSLKLSASGVQIGRSQSVAVVPGQQYVLSGSVRAGLTAGAGRCRVSGTGISSPGIAISFGSADNNAGWKSLSETVTIPAGTSSVTVQCYADAGSAGSINFDALSLSMGSFPLTATEVNETKVALSWPDMATDETGYRIQRCAGAGCTTFAEVGTAGANVTSYTDSGLSAQTVYRYQVQPYKTAVCGWAAPAGQIAEVTTVIMPPTGVVGTLANTTQVNLSWSNNTVNESAIVVEKCTGTGCTNYTQTQLAARSTSWTDTFVAVGGTYQYRVRAKNTTAGWDSGPSAVVTVTSPPLNPPSLVATSLTETQVRLTWSDPTIDETRYSLRRCTVQSGQTTCTGLAEIKSLGANVTSYDDTVGQLGTYVYQVVGMKTADYSWTNPSATVKITPTPLPPTLYSVGVSGTNQLSPYYTLRTSTHNGVLVERCLGINCSTFTQVANVTAPPYTFVDTSVCSGTSYTYRVRATNTVIPWTTDYSTTRYANTTIPVAPSSLSATRVSEVSTALYWTRSSTVDTEGYRIYRCTGAGCSFGTTPLATVSNYMTSSYTDGTVIPGGVYQYKVTGFKSTASCPWETAATNVVQATASLTAPASLSATAVNSANVRLSWQDNTASETAFLIERCTVPSGSSSCSDFTQLAAQAPANSSSSASFVDSTVIPSTTYLYRLRATSTGTQVWTTGYSNTSAPVTTAYQGPPSDLQAVAATTKVTLSWADNTPDETGFTVYRCQGAGCTTFTPLTSVAANSSATAGYVDTTVCGGITYRYQVVANRVAGDTLPSDPVSATTVIPDSPSVTAARTTESQITLNWNDPTTDETGYRIMRCVGGGCTSYTEIATVGPNILTYADTSVMPGYSYSYRVRGYNTVSCGWQTESASATAVTSIAGPTAFTGTAASSTQVNLSWSDSNSYTTGYRIERCTGAGCTGFSEIVLTANATPSYNDTTVSAGTTYRYRVRAARTTPYLWNSSYSDIVEVITPAPVAPAALAAAPSSSTQVNLSWNSGSSDSSGYSIERCEGTGCKSFSEVARVGAGSTSYASQGLTPSTNYCYRVRGYKTAYASWFSGYTPVSCAATVMDNPTTITATAPNSMTVHLSWADSALGEDGYNVETLLPSGQWVTVASLPPDATTFNDTQGISPLHSYSYRVRAFRGSDFSAYSAPATVRTPAYKNVDNTCAQTETNLPAFTSTPVLTAAENVPYSYQVSASAAGGGAVSYSLSSKPTGMTISATGLITWTPDYKQEGTKNVTVRATDSLQRSADQSFAIVVAGVDRAPVIGAISDTTVSVGHLFSVQAYGSDADGDTLSYTLTSAPQGMNITSDGLITWTPLAAAGPTAVTVRVTDGTLSASTTFSVTARSARQPSITSTAPTSAMDGTEYAYQLVVDNPDGYPLSYTLSTAPSGMSVSGAGRISWVPTAAEVGSVPVTVVVSDGVQQASQPFTVVVTQNNVPYIKSTPPTTGRTLTPYSYTVVAVSPAGGSLTYTINKGPSGLSVSSAGVVSWTPTANQWGNFPVSLRVSSTTSSIVQDFTIKVAIPAPTGLTPTSVNGGCWDSYTTVYWNAVPTTVLGGSVTYSVVVNSGAQSAWQTGLSFPNVYVPGGGTSTWKVIARDPNDYTNVSETATTVSDTTCSSGSCPMLYAWDGGTFAFEVDVFGTGKLGLKSGTGYVKPNPRDFHVMQAQPVPGPDGLYDLRLVEERSEVDYMDKVALYTVDMPKGFDVYAEQTPFSATNVSQPATILHTVGPLKKPLSVTHLETGRDVSDLLSASDQQYLQLNDDKNVPAWQTLEIDLGDLSQAAAVKLVLDGVSVYPTSQAASVLANQLSPSSDRTKLEVLDENGIWVTIPRTKLILPKPKEFRSPYVVDLTNVFLSKNYKIRLGFVFKTYLDRIAFDTTADEPVSVNPVPLVSATLGYYGSSQKTNDTEVYGFNYGVQSGGTYNYMPGNNTRYGDVLPLLSAADDKFVIYSGGDEVRLKFGAPIPQPEDADRRFLIYSHGFYKDFKPNSVIPKTVEPLPFNSMTNFPYNESVEQYPADEEHQLYREEYNTRTLP